MGSEMVSRAQEKMRIKSNFTRTCNRFSQFLKERRSFGDIDAFTSIASPKYGMKVDTRTYPTQIQTKLDYSNQENGANNNSCTLVENNINNNKSLNLFPLTSSSSNKDLVEPRELPKSKEEAKENSRKGSMTIIYEGKVVVLEDIQEEVAQKIMCLASEGGVINETTTTTTTTNVSHSNLLDLPIARRASLHRFMDKRKDRYFF
ncbi:hypothetical protein RND81_04G139700 [Saponaria officinalis]|uniref:Protein TIFY n=1 Tax=Saponaria officinalis TaxID=3572 RepID=A0AAW1LMS3_SAPOF